MLPMWAVVDRIEGAVAVLVFDGGQVIDVPSRGLREGDVFRVKGTRLIRDNAEKKRRAAAARRQLQELKRRDPGGDISL